MGSRDRNGESGEEGGKVGFGLGSRAGGLHDREGTSVQRGAGGGRREGGLQ